MSGTLVVLSGPSGVGKDTVIEAWKRVNPKVRKVITCTTRAPREGEENGKDYYFLSEADFQKRVDAGDLLEHKMVHGKSYGTPKSETLSLLADGFVAVLKIDVQGGLAVKEAHPEALLLFLDAPSLKELERRLRERNTDSEEQIESRLETAKKEIKVGTKQYDYRVVNDAVENAVERLERILWLAKSLSERGYTPGRGGEEE
jgi:guanylate kinase